MHPIEKAHKMIIAGNVLSGDGRWVSRNEALKKKRSFLEHVFKGEVEQNGRWIKITDIDTNPVPRPITVPESILSEPVRGNPFEGNNFISSEEESNFHVDESPLVEKGPFPPQFIEEPVQELLPNQEEPDRSTPPPQPVLQQKIREPEPTDTFQKETITIRTIPLGKETTLTISESRAGSALVAICSIQGFIDQGNAEDFQLQLMSMKDFGVRYFIIDMEHTTLIGSVGWGVIAVAARLIKAANGLLLICSMKKEIEEGFFLLQFDKVIDYQKTITDCLDVFRVYIKEEKKIPADNSNKSSTHQMYGELYHDVPIQEKIKIIIAQHGPLSFFKMAALLKEDRYGKETLNPFRLYFILRDLNLETYRKRARFYRSC